MKSIESTFKIIFNTREFSDTNILFFTEDHLHRLETNNVAVSYHKMIAITSKLFNDLLKLHLTKNKKSIKKQELTAEVQQLNEQLIESIRKLEGLVRSQFPKGSETYTSVFPNGLSEYNRMGRSNMQSLMTRILMFLKQNTDHVTPVLNNEILLTYKHYQTKRQEQLNTLDSFKKLLTDKKEARKLLSKQLQKNLYTLAIEYLGQPEKAQLFFKQDLLYTSNEYQFNSRKWNKVNS